MELLPCLTYAKLPTEFKFSAIIPINDCFPNTCWFLLVSVGLLNSILNFLTNLDVRQSRRAGFERLINGDPEAKNSVRSALL